ncbi:MAG TPA: hypothetical protein VFE07_11415 [Marmoricola sp.]|nr:hypothetical protein [Marmoricola sp.]
MTDQSNTPSGSRWEPESQHQTDAGAAPVGPLDDPEAATRRAQLRGRAILAGAATALTLGGGLAGFVIGHATAGDGSDDLRPANFSNQGPGGRLGEGQQGPPSFRSGDGSAPPQGFDEGPSNGSGDSGSGATGSGT